MKRLIIATLSILSILATSCYNEQIEELNNRIDKVESDKIATIENQIASINASIKDMQKMDTQLQDYITALKTQASRLSETLASIETNIESVREELQGYVRSQKTQILATLEEYKLLVSGQLDSINSAIAELQEQKTELGEQTNASEEYIDGEIQSAKDWASATFATLENYNALADIVSGIQAQIETLNDSNIDIEATIRTVVAEELADATADLDDSMKREIEAVAEECSSAISTATEEITAAYEAEIKAAIATSEANMKSWVNTQLAQYYTASQVDSKLSSLKSTFETKLELQKTYLPGLIESLEQTLAERIDDNEVAIDELNGSISALTGELATIAGNVTTNAKAISTNAEAIRENAKLIAENAEGAGPDAIEDNRQLIEANQRLIAENNTLIKANQSEIQNLKSRATEAESSIVANAGAIADNAADIATNASLIAQNATAVSNNGAAIASNAQEIESLKTQLQKTKEEITEAYKAAISTAITSLDGKLSGQVATEIETLNTRIDTEVATINAAIDALSARVTQCEKDIKTIKTSIYNIQIEISDIQEQIEAILSRIQSIAYIPAYADGKATMYYTNNDKITAGSATFDFELQPASTAKELAEVWEEAITMKAVYTQTKAAVDFVDMTVESVTAEDGVLTVVVSGASLKEDFFLGRISANACLVISDGNNELASEYVNMVPWTTDVLYIPDEAFKTYLLENFDADSDGEISEDEALDIEDIDLSDVTTKVATLAGIEYMKNLKTLNAPYHSITNLDLSHNPALTEVVINNNKIKTLDLSGCVAIVTLECSSNKLTSLDVSEASGLTDLVCSNNDLGALNLTNNKSLVNLQCSGNKIAVLNLKNLLSLETLYCRSNDLTVLDLSKNTLLKELDCSSNNLTTLNLNKNTALETVYCRSNSLASLYLNECGNITMLDCSKNNLTAINLTGCKSVETLNCSDNSIVILDLSALKNLETLNCSGNDFASLDVSANSALLSIDCSDNASLAKLWVKDEAHQLQIIFTKDDATNLFFNAGGLVFPDKALETYMLANYDDDYDGVISIAEADNVTTVNCANKGISDLTGLESCTNLVYLNCSNNNLQVVDCHTLTKLESLSCYGNPVEVLDLTNCAVLQSLFLQNVSTNAVSGTTISVNGYDQAASLRFSVANTPFKTLSIVNSSVLTDLNVLSNDNLEVFKGYGNTALTTLTLSPYFKEVHAYGCSVLEGTDVSDISGLTVLDLHGCNLQTLNVDSNPELVTLDCSSNQLTSLNVDNNTGLVTLKVNGNNLTQFKVANNTALETLWVSDNQLSAINVRSNTALKDLRMSNNDITALNFTYNTVLENLYIDGLSISEVNLVENTSLKYIDFSNNALLTCAYTADSFTIENTVISIDYGMKILDASGNNYNLNPTVGAYIIVNGCKGVVYYAVNTFGKSRIVSIYEADLKWSTESVTTLATSSNDGMVNMNTIKASNSDLSKYPAFKWCADYGKDWYLPARDELYTIHNLKSELNATLFNVGGITLGTLNYWSSTELNNSQAYCKSSYNSKSNAYQVRAVRAL